MLLERNQTVIGVIAIIVVLVGTVFAVVATRGGFVPGTAIEAEFSDAAGLEPRAFVFIAGVRVGQVSSVEIATDCTPNPEDPTDTACARVGMVVDAPVPDDSHAAIILQNALGKRGVEVIIGSSPTLLSEGGRLTAPSTTPVDFPELGDRTVDLLSESDIDSLDLLTTAVADITEGNREDVTALIDGVDKLTQVIADKKDALRLVIQRTEVLVDAAADKDTEIIRIIDAFGSTLDRLSNRRAELTTLLQETAAVTDVAADLLGDERRRIDRVLTELNADLNILENHQVELAHALAYGGTSIWGFANIGYGHGNGESDPQTGNFVDNERPPANPEKPCSETGCGWGNILVDGLGAVGVKALFGCGAPIDVIITGIVGPDPACSEAAAAGREVTPVPDIRPVYSGLRSWFFAPGGAR